MLCTRGLRFNNNIMEPKLVLAYRFKKGFQSINLNINATVL